MCCLYGKHRSHGDQVRELWVRANPDFNEKVGRDELLPFLKNMMHVVVQKPMLYLQSVVR